jgi:hypothetical protein
MDLEALVLTAMTADAMEGISVDAEGYINAETRALLEANGIDVDALAERALTEEDF